jgi:hypothetical protein
MSKSYIKTFGELLIRRFSPIMLFLVFIGFPGLVLFALLNNTPEGNFVNKLLYYLGVVYVGGGFFFVGIKLWELWDNKFIVLKRGQWKGTPVMRRVFYKVCIPEGFDRNPADMIGLFYDMRNLVGGTRTKHELYNLGKWYYDWAFDIIVRKGVPEMYMSFPFKRTDYVLKTFKARYPEIKLVQTEDPYARWPKKWEPGKTNLGPYEGFHAFDMGLASTGPHPLCDPAGLPCNALGELLQSFSDFDKNVMFVWQYVFRPFPTDSVEKGWIDELTKLKSDMLGRSTRFEFTDSEGKKQVGNAGDLVTDSQKKTIDEAEAKISDAHFRAHLKLMVFYPKGKAYYGAITEKMVKGFTGQTSGGSNIVVKDWFTSTDRFFLSTKEGLLDSILGPFMDRFYHAKEIVYRAKIQYDSLSARDPDISHDSTKFFLSVPSCAALFHFPNIPIFPEEFEKKKSKPQQPEAKERYTNRDPEITDGELKVSFSKLNQLRNQALNKQQPMPANVVNQPKASNLPRHPEMQANGIPKVNNRHNPPVNTSVSVNQFNNFQAPAQGKISDDS